MEKQIIFLVIFLILSACAVEEINTQAQFSSDTSSKEVALDSNDQQTPNTGADSGEETKESPPLVILKEEKKSVEPLGIMPKEIYMCVRDKEVFAYYFYKPGFLWQKV